MLFSFSEFKHSLIARQIFLHWWNVCALTLGSPIAHLLLAALSPSNENISQRGQTCSGIPFHKVESRNKHY